MKADKERIKFLLYEIKENTLDLEKILRILAIENSLLVLGVLSFLISIYNQFILGMKLGFLFLFL